jgi:hypothetical protein
LFLESGAAEFVVNLAPEFITAERETRPWFIRPGLFFGGEAH